MVKSYFFIVFFLSCVAERYILHPPPLPPIVYPDKEIAEIFIYGHYAPKDPSRLERVKRSYIKRGWVDEGESFEEKYPEYLDNGDESFTFSGGNYCYNKTKKKDKKSVPHHNLILKARLYDKKGNLLEEDFLRLDFPEDYDEEGRYSEEYLKKHYRSPPGGTVIPEEIRDTPEDGILELRSMEAYLPYNKAGYEIRIVRLEGEKEVILFKIGVMTKAELRKRSGRLNTSKRRPRGWEYDEEVECHLSPGSK